MSGSHGDVVRTDQTASPEHANRWILLDGAGRLLAIGAAPYDGTSPRTGLDVVGKRVLLPRMRQAGVDGLPRHAEVTRYGGHSWQATVQVITGPVCGAALGVLGCYGPDAVRFPPPPVVGAWEWEVRPPGPGQVLRNHWSPAMFDVYGLPHGLPHPDSARALRGADHAGEAARRGYVWEGARWLDELVHASDRVAMRLALERFARLPPGELFTHVYRVRPDGAAPRTLRLAGRGAALADGESAEGQRRWVRGVSMRTSPEARASDASGDGVAGYLEAALLLAGPACVIDTAYEHIYLTSADFAELGLALPEHRRLSGLCHPEDLPALRTLLRQVTPPTQPDATTDRGTATGWRGWRRSDPLPVRLAAAEGDWQAVAVTAVAAPLDGANPRDVLCRFTRR